MGGKREGLREEQTEEGRILTGREQEIRRRRKKNGREKEPGRW